MAFYRRSLIHQIFSSEGLLQHGTHLSQEAAALDLRIGCGEVRTVGEGGSRSYDRVSRRGEGVCILEVGEHSEREFISRSSAEPDLSWRLAAVLAADSAKMSEVDFCFLSLREYLSNGTGFAPLDDT